MLCKLAILEERAETDAHSSLHAELHDTPGTEAPGAAYGDFFSLAYAVTK